MPERSKGSIARVPFIGSAKSIPLVPVSKWFNIIGDPTIADAICDRVLHTAYTVQLKGPSWWKQQGKNSGQNVPLRDSRTMRLKRL